MPCVRRSGLFNRARRHCEVVPAPRVPCASFLCSRWQSQDKASGIGLLSAASTARCPRRAARPATPPASASGLQVPRFVSLKSDRVNVRGGPTKDHDVAWVFTRSGLPVEITAEFENWRRIRDGEGAEGWVYHSLLSGTPDRDGGAESQGRSGSALRPAGRRAGATVARFQAGVLASVKRCNGNWCRDHRRRLRRLGARRSGSGASIRTKRSIRPSPISQSENARPKRARQTEFRTTKCGSVSDRLSQPHHHVDARDLVAFGAIGILSTITSAPGMSTSSFSPSTKKW